MAEFYESSLWMKLTMMLVSGAFSMHLFAMDQPDGWSGYQVQRCSLGISFCKDENAARAVEALEVIGFLSVLIALLLSLCLVLLDELKGNKIALICLCFFSFLAGLAIIIGIAVFEGTTNVYTNHVIPDGTEFASTVGVMAGICALLAGVFCILQLAGVCVWYSDRFNTRDIHGNTRDIHGNAKDIRDNPRDIHGNPRDIHANPRDIHGDARDKARDMDDHARNKVRDIDDNARDKARDIHDNARDKARDIDDNVREKARDIHDNARNKARDIDDNVRDKARDIHDNARDKARDLDDNVRDKARDIHDNARNKARDLDDNVRDKARDVQGKARDIHDNVRDNARVIHGHAIDMLD